MGFSLGKGTAFSNAIEHFRYFMEVFKYKYFHSVNYKYLIKLYLK